MGTSLCLSAAPWPTRPDGTPVDPTDLVADMRAQTETLGLLAAEEVCEEVHGDSPEVVLDGEQLADRIGWVRASVTEAIDYLLVGPDASAGWFPRDVATLTLDGKVWIFAGGPDGGDGYEALNTLKAVGFL